LAKITKASYAVLLAVTTAHFLNHIYVGALSPFLPLIQIELFLTYTEVGVVTSAAVIAMTLSHFVVGYLGDRGSRWRDGFISVSILLSALAMILVSYSSGFLVLAVFQFFLGAGASGYHPSVFPALAEKFPQRDLAKATGIQAIGGLLGMAVIPFLGVTLLVVLGGWRPSLFFLGVMGFVIFIPFIILMRYSSSGYREGFISQEEECEGADGWTRSYWLGLIYVGLRGMSFRSTSLLMPLYLVATYTVDLVWAGYLTTIMLSAGLVGEVVAAPLSDRMNKRVPFLILSNAIATPALFLLNYSLSEGVLIIILIVIGFFFYLGIPPNTAYLTEVSPRENRGLAFGLLFSIGAIPGAISPIIFGMIGDSFGLSASVLFLVIVTGLAAIVALFMKDVKPTRSVRDAQLSLDSPPPIE
jgi:FSR family fosmidomycin resistance protein-like MFS transporter